LKPPGDEQAETSQPAGAAKDAALAGPGPARQRRPTRFTHASGTRPLEGYTIKRGVGSGGFGEVYFAVSDAGKEVALKRIQRNLDIELRGVRQCLNLKHVNLISLWDIRTTHDGESWVVMEYVPGHSLRDALENAPNGLPEEVTKHWFTSIAAGVNYLHDRGIVHRDLKPGNVFYDTDEQVVKIGDYGLSKFISTSRRSGQTESVGTFHYMAPEIGKGVYGKQIDIYALGVMLYEMLSGRLPFDGESAQEIIMKHLTDDPDLSTIPTPFRDVVERALAKDPEWRYASVPELCADLPWDEVAANAKVRLSSGASNPSSALALDPRATSRGNSPPASQRVAPPSETTSDLDDLVFVDANNGGRRSSLPDISFGKVQYHSVDSTPTAPGRSPTNPQTLLQRNANDSLPAGARPVKREPIAAAVRGSMTEILGWWNNPELATPFKVFIATIGALVLLINSAWLLPLALVLALCYLVYYCFRTLTMPADHEVAPKLSKRELRLRQQWVARQWLGSRPFTDRMTELLGSLLVAAAAGGLLSLVGLAIGPAMDGIQPKTTELESWATYAWLAISSVLGSWGVLIASKSWEHRLGDFWLRRLTLTGIGVAVGLASFMLARFIGVDLVDSVRAPAAAGPELVSSVSYLLYPAVVFALPNWSAVADPLRKTRLSLFQVGICLLCAVFAAELMDIDAKWQGVLIAITAVSTQLAAPWLAPGQREQLVRERGFE
jgi:serine/threonine protein kinase